MKRLSVALALALIPVFATACEDITNPVEDSGEQTSPYVRFLSSNNVGTPGATVRVVIFMPTRIEEDVDIDYTFGGDAVFGTDFEIVDRTGNPRTDVTAAGGSMTLTYDAEQTLFPADTIYVQVTFDAADGHTLTIELADASGAGGTEVGTGFVDKYHTYDLNIEGFVDIPTGTYAGQRTGDLGDVDIQVQISNTPTEIDGVTYAFVLSEYTGDVAFGLPIPWAFNVTSGGTVFPAGRSFGAADFVTSIVSGSFDFDTGTLAMDMEIDCCGVAGFAWTISVTAQ